MEPDVATIPSLPASEQPATAPGSLSETPPASVMYYIDPTTSKRAGPADAYSIAGLLDAGILNIDTLVWTGGDENWTPLKDCADIYSQVYYLSSVGLSKPPSVGEKATPGDVQNAANVAVEIAAGGGIPEKRGAIAAAAPTVPANLDQIQYFNAEMNALGEAPRSKTLHSETEGPATPPPEDQEFEDDDGTIYKWDPKLRKFQPRDLMAVQPGSELEYGLDEMTFQEDDEKIPIYEPPTKEEEKEEGSGGEAEAEDTTDAKPSEAEKAFAEEFKDELGKELPKGSGTASAKGKKRKPEEVFERIAEKQKRAKEQAEAQKNWFDMKVNTSVYVTGLPDDITDPELAERFSRYGVLKPGEDGPRVKIYRDKVSQIPKGDGLVTFLYEPSVALACKLADDDYFREGMVQKMRVQAAKFEMHGSQYVPKKKASSKKNSKQKAKLADKVLGWGGFDDKLAPTQVTVILKNLFHPDEFIEEPTLLKDLEADILEECTKLGPVEKVKIFAGNSSGVVSVKFKEEKGAQECIAKMSGRFFGGRKVEAGMWDGFSNFNVKLQETPEQQAARLERFSRELEEQGPPSQKPPEASESEDPHIDQQKAE